MPMPMPYTPGQAPLTAPTLTSTFHNHSPEPFSEQGCKATTTSPMSLQNAEAPASSRHHVGPSPAPYVPRSRNTHANQIGGGGAGAALPTPAAISVSSLYGTSFVSPASRSCFARCAPPIISITKPTSVPIWVRTCLPLGCHAAEPGQECALYGIFREGARKAACLMGLQDRCWRREKAS